MTDERPTPISTTNEKVLTMAQTATAPELVALGERLAKLLTPERLLQMRLEGERLSAMLARRGWPMPMNIAPAEAWDALEAAGDVGAAELDEFFVAHYSGDGGRYFDYMASELLTAPGLARRQLLLEECVAAYRQGLHRIAIPSLLLVIEGAVVDLGGKGKIVDRCRQHFAAANPDCAIRMIWSSLAPFIETIFEDGRTSSGDVINRNLILHGRSEPEEWTVADALRLFCALHAIAVVGP
jgi:hypothetical protein